MSVTAITVRLPAAMRTEMRRRAASRPAGRAQLVVPFHGAGAVCLELCVGNVSWLCAFLCMFWYFFCLRVSREVHLHCVVQLLKKITKKNHLAFFVETERGQTGTPERSHMDGSAWQHTSAAFCGRWCAVCEEMIEEKVMFLKLTPDLLSEATSGTSVEDPRGTRPWKKILHFTRDTAYVFLFSRVSTPPKR